MLCRFCRTELEHPLIDLFNSPPSNSFLTKEQLDEPEPLYPLKVWVCTNCWLVQVAEYKKATEIFSSSYVYFSSYSKAWLAHASAYAEAQTARWNLGANSLVTEIASNDGYLLQYFHQRGIPVLGVEPSSSTAVVAQQKGIRTHIEYFGEAYGRKLAADGLQADLMAGNNVLAHVPDLHDFAEGFRHALKPTGVVTFEFPHLVQMIRHNQFDTIYHEHFSYLSLTFVKALFAEHGLRVFDVEEIPTHGGSLRVYLCHDGNTALPTLPTVPALLQTETQEGVTSLGYYHGFQERAFKIKQDFLRFLLDAKAQGKTVAAYGAAAKGNTLLNYCGVRSDLIDFVVDASPYKQNLYLPFSHIPVVHEDQLRQAKPDYIVILPWNLMDEITTQLAYCREWGAKFVAAIPNVRVID